MNFSIYTTCYLVNKNKFSFLANIDNFFRFAGPEGEVIIGTCEEGITDGTLDILNRLIEYNNLNNVKIVVSKDIRFSQNTFDGDLKNFALQNTKHPIKIQMDMDESFVLSQRNKWINYSVSLLNSDYQAIFVPSIDVYGDIAKIRANHQIGQKWRIHKAGLKRGVWKAAKLENGLFQTNMSDSSELLDQNNELVKTANIVPQEALNPYNSRLLNDYIYTMHLGFLSLDYRQQINANWWKEKWEDRSKKTENVVIDKNILEKEAVIDHNLSLT